MRAGTLCIRCHLLSTHKLDKNLIEGKAPSSHTRKILPVLYVDHKAYKGKGFYSHKGKDLRTIITLKGKFFGIVLF